MITLYNDDNTTTNLYTVSDVARALKVTPGALYDKIHDRRVLPSPSTLHGKRKYYTEFEYEAIVSKGIENKAKRK